MKSNRTHSNTLVFLALIFAAIVFTHCKSNTKYDNQASAAKKDTINQETKKLITTNGTDSVQLTALIRKLYKWHETDKMKYDGFKPLKSNPSDTLYSSIDLNENAKAIEELKETSLFANTFLDNYRKIAVRMDKELRDGSSLWPEGELSTFGDDSDMWCSCQDFPVNDYWNIIRLTNINFNGNNADFNWTWGADFVYKAKATKEDGAWKISYLQGFDMNAYSWEWWKKNKKAGE